MGPYAKGEGVSMQDQSPRLALITGGAGFIGSNLAERLLSEPDVRVRVYDNLSRPGVHHNLSWLTSLGAGRRLEVIHGDVRDARGVREAVHGVNEIYHLAAQVAVTSSLEDPGTDFEVNALGTLNVLEAARLSGEYPFLLYTSTNKVYGGLENIPVEVNGTRYRAVDPSFQGVDEGERLDFHSPYGCSKGAADQYVRDYARIYDLPTVVFRMSCIAGPRQFGNEDQGWVAHFLYSMLIGKPITIYGDGYQVRDILHVHDLLDAIHAARLSLTRTRGEIYNLGGSMDRVVSVIDLLRQIKARSCMPLQLQYSAVRPGDQPLYISNTRKFTADTGWQPQRSVEKILDDILTFWKIHQDVIQSIRPALQSAMVETIMQEVIA